MGYSQENGYVPSDIETILVSIMENYNNQFGTEYTFDSFKASNAYKYFYALAQRVQEGEVKTSEVFLKLQQYFLILNERISRPAVTNPGIIETLEEAGYTTSVKPMVLADAGKSSICIDVDDGVHAEGNVTITSYANLVSGTDDVVTINGTAFTAQTGAATPGDATFQAATSNAATAASLALQINSHATVSLVVRARAVGAICVITAQHGGTAGNSITLGYTDNDSNVGATKSGTTLADGEDNADYTDIKAAIAEIISNCVVGGVVTQGLESTAVVLSNGQSFDWKYFLPDKIEPLLKLTITQSENNEVEIADPDDIKATLLANIAARYRLGKNFEPQRYYSVVDAPWAASVLLEYSLDAGATWLTAVYNADFDELFDIQLANITLVEV